MTSFSPKMISMTKPHEKTSEKNFKLAYIPHFIFSSGFSPGFCVLFVVRRQRMEWAGSLSRGSARFSCRAKSAFPRSLSHRRKRGRERDGKGRISAFRTFPLRFGLTVVCEKHANTEECQIRP